MTEAMDILGYFAKLGAEVPAYSNPTRKETIEVWMDPIRISEETYKKIVELLKEEVKKNA